MHALQGNAHADTGKLGSAWISGRKRGGNALAAEANAQSSRLQRAGLFVKREGRFRGLQEKTVVTPRDLTHTHRGVLEYAESTKEVTIASRWKGSMIAPMLLIMAFLLMNARLHSGNPPNIQAVVWVWAYTWPMVALAGFARLLPAMKIARQRWHSPQPQADLKKIMGAALLVAGGTVGAGIVALPVKTATVGLLPSAAGLVGGWGYMLLTAFLIVDVSEHCGPGANFTTMAARTLGKRWKAVSAALYIFVYCATLTAYIAESATFIGPPVAMVLGYGLPPATLSALFALAFGGVIAMGSRAVDAVNTTCVLVALAAFGLLLGIGGTGLSWASLAYCNWSGAVRTVPIMIVAFTFHNMIPSLFDYLKSAAAVRVALVIGTLIPLAMYLLWEVLILGSLPPGTRLASVGDLVQMMGGAGAVPVAINVFSLFAIITSFLGVGMGCIDFVKDLAGRPTKGKGESGSFWAVVATMAPPLCIACLCPKLFVAALEISGMLRLVLFAIIPTMMVRTSMKSEARKGWIAAGVAGIAVLIILVDVAGRLGPVLA